ncbi:MAG: imidazoleglycerol-phosphate dehydratase HisB [Verrucomicrobia bacterium]|nr:imidazoleglycerol-phosphate dehydratase HisB [Verrucomicrobiota bacterium]MDA1064918.1 imidazoleglycerol-phosphate dehydratase HisB [Verrucomicrobiota bacterium]
MAEKRIVSISRKTAETDIALTINLDGTGEYQVDTGIPFFDHMLCLFAKHGLFDLDLKAVGDIEVDYHHTVEDVGIVLGDAIKQALGEKLGIRRYGFFILPMDESIARVTMDLSNRPFLKYDVQSPTNYIRDFNIVLIREFFQAVVNSLSANIHLKVEYGDEPHHIVEALFKCFARALDVATSVDPRTEGKLPSTKEKLT